MRRAKLSLLCRGLLKNGLRKKRKKKTGRSMGDKDVGREKRISSCGWAAAQKRKREEGEKKK